MRNRWLVLVVVASLCLNVAVVGTYFLHRARRGGLRRFPARGLTPDVRERLRKARAEALPEFAALAEKVEATDSLLWTEMRSESPDSARVESLCQELGQIHGKMRAMVFRQMHRELQLMPGAARIEYLNHMMTMRPGFGGPGAGMGRHMRPDPRMPHGDGPPLDEPPPGLPPESGD
jgi:hypothetical protein